MCKMSQQLHSHTQNCAADTNIVASSANPHHFYFTTYSGHHQIREHKVIINKQTSVMICYANNTTTAVA
jgi:hypothetical protein